MAETTKEQRNMIIIYTFPITLAGKKTFSLSASQKGNVIPFLLLMDGMCVKVNGETLSIPLEFSPLKLSF